MQGKNMQLQNNPLSLPSLNFEAILKSVPIPKMSPNLTSNSQYIFFLKVCIHRFS